MGGGSFSSDQSSAHATSTAQMVSLNKRARLTSIQAKGNASGSIIFKSGGASGTTIATYLFGTEGFRHVSSRETVFCLMMVFMQQLVVLVA